MNKLILLFVFVLLGFEAYASTFVGNGGSVLDTELAGTLRRLKDSVRAVQDDEQICECAGESSQCALLKDLNLKQHDFCQDFVEEMAGPLLTILNDKNLKIRWTTKVSGSDRSFDAAAQAKSKTFIIDENRFASIGPADRVQLMAHELLHLLSYQNQALIDGGARGPFDGSEGGRRLLDSAGAAYTIVGMRAQKVPSGTNSVSRPFKNLYITYAGGSRTLDKDLKRSSLQKSNVDSETFELNWYPRYSSNLGYSLGLYSEDGTFTKNPDLNLKSHMHLDAVTAGVNYRVVPFQSRVDWVDSIQLIAGARLGIGKVSYDLSDNFAKLSDRSNLMLFKSQIEVNLPLLWNFWLVLSEGMIYSPYNIDSLNIKAKTFNLNNSVGVGYGISL